MTRMTVGILGTALAVLLQVVRYNGPDPDRTDIDVDPIIGMVLCAVILAALNVVYMSKMIKEETELLAPILSAVLLPSIVFCLLPDLGELFAGNRR
jgi:hypothetical protein